MPVKVHIFNELSNQWYCRRCIATPVPDPVGKRLVGSHAAEMNTLIKKFEAQNRIYRRAWWPKMGRSDQVKQAFRNLRHSLQRLQNGPNSSQNKDFEG